MTLYGDRVEGLGTAGVPAGGVLSVQGVAGGTPFAGNITQWGSVAVAPAETLDDTMSSGVNAPLVAAIPALFNDVTAQTTRARVANADAKASTGIAAEGPMLWNGASFDRLRSLTGAVNFGAIGSLETGIALINKAGGAFNTVGGGPDNTDAQGADGLERAMSVIGRTYYWDGATWSRLRSSESGAPGITEQAAIGSGANAALAPTLAAAVGATCYVQGFTIDGLGATTALVVAVTLVGLLGGTMTYRLAVPAGVGVVIPRIFIEFDRPIPASATNVAIVLNVPAFGAGNTQAQAQIHGFRKVN